LRCKKQQAKKTFQGGIAMEGENSSRAFMRRNCLEV